MNYESMITPPQTLEIDLANISERKVLHEKMINGYDKNLYECDRKFVTSRDGFTQIPISVVYMKAAFQERPRPTHLLGYGAYGHSLDASFSPIRLPLLNRGCICIVAHCRGGGELGRQWHDAGRGIKKLVSVNDFVDVAIWLVKERWTTPEMLGCEGRSAGGTLVAAAMNEKSNLCKVALLVVPFLDPLLSMSDPSLPLTTIEYLEWGDPHDNLQFESIRQWSPIQNICLDNMHQYPNVMLIGGLKDTRVFFWELLKFGATLRDSIRKTTINPYSPNVLVRMNANAGHSFSGNQEKYFSEISSMYAFFLEQIGATKRINEANTIVKSE